MNSCFDGYRRTGRLKTTRRAVIIGVIGLLSGLGSPLVAIPTSSTVTPIESTVGNFLPASGTNGETLTGTKQIRIFGPWRARDGGSVAEGFADLEGGVAAQTIRLVIYALTERDGGYAPGTLVGTSEAVSVPACARRGWVRFAFPAACDVTRNTRYGLAIWFVDAGGAKLWTENRLGGRWDVDATDKPPVELNLSTDTGRNEDLPGLYLALRIAGLAEPPTGMIRLTPGELPPSTPVTNPLASPQRWSDQTIVPGMREAVAYRRFTWKQVEGNTPGKHDWGVIYKEIAAAKTRGQSYAFRVRARVSEYEIPPYLSGLTFNDAKFRERHQALHRAMRAEFDRNPDVAWIDLDGPGNWGEWRNGDWKDITQEAKDDVAKYLGEIWRGSQTPTPMFTVGSHELALMRSVNPGVSFRNDIWGGEGAASQMWSRQAVTERMAIIDSGERGTLLTGEIDSAISHWSVRSLHQHILWFGPHSVANGNFKGHGGDFSRFSAAEQAELKEAYGKLGYRLVIQHVDVPQTVHNGVPADMTFYWQNRNVTVPVGKDVGTAQLRLVNAAGQIAATCPLAVNVCALLPTWVQPHVRHERVTVSGVPAGTYTLQVVVRMRSGHTMNLGNTGRTAEGAYPLGSINIR